MTLAIQSQQAVAQKPVVENKEAKKEDTGITFSQWWNGEKSLTSVGARYIGLDGLADWLEDKDKVCTDGKDDGKVGFWEGLKSFGKGLLGGIPKAIIQHPLVSGAAVAVGAGLLFATGGAAAPLLWGAGALATAVTAGTNIYKAATAETDGEMKAALEGTGTATQSAILLGTTYNSTMATAKTAGVNTEGNIVQTMKSSAEISARNAKANYMTWKTGVLHGNSNSAREGVQTGYQAEKEAVEVYRINIKPELSVEENLANNPGLSYNAEGGYYYKIASWGEELVYNPKMENGHWMLTRSADDQYLIKGNELRDNFVDAKAFLNDGTKNYMKPETFEPGATTSVVKQAPARFKIAPEGTKYMSAEGPATLQPKSVLRIDNDGHLYQSTVEFMFKKVNNLTPEQIQMLKSIDPEAAAKYGY